ncbi:MAG: SLC13 family permease [Arenimonas sp.]
MTVDQWIVLIVAMAAMAAFVSERVPTEIVSLCVLCVLAITGVVDTSTALSGFASDAVVAVGAMFVLSAALESGGALQALPELLSKYAKSRNWFRALLMPITGVLSAFVNNTAVVAVLIPTVIRLCRERGWSPQRFLIPLSYSSQFGGVCTLIGTSTNLLVHALAIKAGLPGFSMFEFTALGSVFMAAGIVYVMVSSRWLLPDRPGKEVESLFELNDFVTELAVTSNSPAGRSVQSLNLPGRMGLTPIDLIRGETRFWRPDNEILEPGDVLRVSGAVRDLTALDPRAGLVLRPTHELGATLASDQRRRLIQVLLPTGSAALGRTPSELGLAWRYNAVLLAVRRHGTPITRELSDVHMQVGDVALLMSTESGAAALQDSHDFVVLREEHHRPVQIGGILWPLGIVTAVVAVAAIGWLPIYLSALVGCIALVLTRTISSTDAFAAVQWRVLFLIAGMLPLGLAMEQTGLASIAVQAVLRLTGDVSPIIMLSLLYLTVAVLTEFLSNNAAAVLMVPVGLSLAQHFDVDPKPFLVAITFAASSSFTTPVGYQTNTMVYDAGDYRFADFVRIGLPLNVLFWLLASVLIPYFFPFSALVH